MLTTDDVLGAPNWLGLGPMTEEGASSAWTVYFHTPDADATAKAVEQGGAELAIWQPGTVKSLEAVTDIDTLCWVELRTADPVAAQGFYRALFGWRSEEIEAPGMAYTVLSTADGDQQEASFGGVAPLQDDAQQPRWLLYFQVADTDAIVARTQANGGSVLVPVMDVPDIGRMAWLPILSALPSPSSRPRPPQRRDAVCSAAEPISTATMERNGPETSVSQASDAVELSHDAGRRGPP